MTPNTLLPPTLTLSEAVSRYVVPIPMLPGQPSVMAVYQYARALGDGRHEYRFEGCEVDNNMLIEWLSEQETFERKMGDETVEQETRLNYPRTMSSIYYQRAVVYQKVLRMLKNRDALAAWMAE